VTIDTEGRLIVDDAPARAANEAATEEPGGGLIQRMRDRGQELAKGRRLVIPLPGWEDLGDGRGLWARFVPVTRKRQVEFGWALESQEVDVIAPMLVGCCEEILIGTAVERTPLANEPDVRAAALPLGFDVAAAPLGFDHVLGQVLGTGGDDGAAVVKRLLIRGDDDLPFYAVWAELLSWSTNVYAAGVETAAGE
jgi:hypothetical protein